MKNNYDIYVFKDTTHIPKLDYILQEEKSMLSKSIFLKKVQQADCVQPWIILKPRTGY